MKPSALYSGLMAELLSELVDNPAQDDIPVGALIVDQNLKIISKAFNIRVKNNDPTGHAEIEVMRLAGNKLNTWRLDDYTMIVTLEPCLMCTGAILQARLKRVVFGAYEQKSGSLVSRPYLQVASWPEIIPGVMEEECSSLIKNWFAEKRISRYDG
jgi:tRNA(adenine34) deaminase